MQVKLQRPWFDAEGVHHPAGDVEVSSEYLVRPADGKFEAGKKYLPRDAKIVEVEAPKPAPKPAAK